MTFFDGFQKEMVSVAGTAIVVGV